MKMHYSRRELYALGEPIGDSATYQKADGGLVLGDGGGGGSSPAPAPANTTQTATQELPTWARGYAKDVLAKGQALTDISKNPYQSYGGERVADFSNLQKQSFASAGPQGYQATVGAYMSPFIQNVIAQQQKGAIEQANIQAGALNAKAAQMGAFGGSGLALQRAQQGRDLQGQLSGIEARGLQDAYTQATQQYNTGLQQLQTLGAQQQAQRQKELDIPYQEFLNQQNYPYRQLSYMSDLVRGTPVGLQSSNQMYQAPPSSLSQIAGLGLTGAAMYGMTKAKGGKITEPKKKKQAPAGLAELAIHKMG